jgi:8-oxo-dGTP pyrophosphatase MutT (NUDIX family)
MPAVDDPLAALLRDFQPEGADETADLARVRDLVRSTADPWSRDTPLHVTASALIVYPESGQILLRWHPRQQAWLQVGGHADPGERDPLAIALREAAEETGLSDLSPWPEPALTHLVVVPVTAGRGEPEHRHADLRFLLATGRPDEIAAERPDAPLRWLSAPDAAAATSEPNLRETLSRARRQLAAARPADDPAGPGALDATGRADGSSKGHEG